MGIWYTTRESVKRALDSAETARNNSQVDQAIDAASRSVEGLTHRKFYPLATTRYFDWPSQQRGRSWRLWLDDAELISLTSLTAGGVALPTGNLLLEPANDGPPYTSIEVNLSTNSAFQAGDTHQRAIAITGLFGYSADVAEAGALAGGIDTTQTAIACYDASLIGVGDIIRIEEERMIVTNRGWASTAQTLQTPLTASTANVTVAVSNGAAYHAEEVLLIDSERMLVVDVSSNNLTVKRAWDGSVLAAHTAPTIYANRSLTVTRGALGTTAATHLDTTLIRRHEVPGLIQQLAKAEALVRLGQESAGYARRVGSGDGERDAAGGGLPDLRKQVYRRLGRKARLAAI